MLPTASFGSGRRASGFTILELLTSCIVISIVAGVLLHRLAYYEEVSEKAQMEYTIAQLNSALRVRMATMMTQGRLQQLASLAQENPIDWLDTRPTNYTDHPLTHKAVKREAGIWYFDRARHRLVYMISTGDNFSMPDEAGQTARPTARQIELQVRLIKAGSSDTGNQSATPPIVNAVLEVVRPYRWF